MEIAFRRAGIEPSEESIIALEHRNTRWLINHTGTNVGWFELQTKVGLTTNGKL